MPYQGLVDAGELVAVVLAVRAIVLVVVLEHAGIAAHTFRPAVGADGVVELARLRADGVAVLACRPHAPVSGGASRPRRESRLAYSVRYRVELGLGLLHWRWAAGRLIHVGLLALHPVEKTVADVVHVTDRRQSQRPTATVAWVRSAELRLLFALAQVSLELHLAGEAPTLRDILSQLSLLNDTPRLILAPSMAEAVHALITGIVYINPVLAVHSGVEMPAELA
jgi:hypothetical protein